MRNIVRVVAILAGSVLVGSGLPAFAQTGDCYVQYPGCLDLSFNGGWVITDVLPYKYSSIHALAVQKFGQEERIVAAGISYELWTLARYKPDGTLDPAFGSGGIAQTNTGGSLQGIAGLAVQPDNKLVAVGSVRSKTLKFAIARYTEDGRLDTAFGPGGLVVVDFEMKGLNNNTNGSVASAVALQSDGKIVAVGTTGPNSLAVVRLNLNGSLDTTFALGGKFVYSNHWCGGEAVAIQSVGTEERIVVAGYLRKIPSRKETTYPYNSVMRLTAGGTLDPAFGAGGIVITNFPGSGGVFKDLKIDVNNRLVAVGYAGSMAIARYNVDGTLDTSFNTTGTLTEQLNAQGLAVAIQSNGALLVAGITDRAAIWRFNPDGTRDPGFGVGGLVQTSGAAGASALALQSDSKFVVGGDSFIGGVGKFALARYFR